MSALSFDTIQALLHRWRADPGGTYQSWFLWERRLKHFRSIRRGLQAVVEEIDAGTFGTAYRGSSLETVVHSIAEQRQIFKGADHAFLWKPKLRIPDIYENPGFYPVSTDGLIKAENSRSRRATLRRMRGLWNRSM